MKPKLISFYMDIAIRTAQLSEAQRLKVGSVIVKNGNILSFGWNGTPSGFPNECEYMTMDEEYKTKPEVLHAESNAILKVAKSTESIVGSDLFCTYSPCIECAKLILQSEIKTVYYKHIFRSTDGLELLKKGKISVIKID